MVTILHLKINAVLDFKTFHDFVNYVSTLELSKIDIKKTYRPFYDFVQMSGDPTCIISVTEGDLCIMFTQEDS